MSQSHKDLNFTRLTQTKWVDGKGVIEEKIFPYRKSRLMMEMKKRLIHQSPSFWHDLAKKGEAFVDGPFNSRIHFKLEPINGDDPDDYYRYKAGKPHTISGKA